MTTPSASDTHHLDCSNCGQRLENLPGPYLASRPIWLCQRCFWLGLVSYYRTVPYEEFAGWWGRRGEAHETTLSINARMIRSRASEYEGKD